MTAELDRMRVCAIDLRPEDEITIGGGRHWVCGVYELHERPGIVTVHAEGPRGLRIVEVEAHKKMEVTRK